MQLLKQSITCSGGSSNGSSTGGGGGGGGKSKAGGGGRSSSRSCPLAPANSRPAPTGGPCGGCCRVGTSEKTSRSATAASEGARGLLQAHHFNVPMCQLLKFLSGVWSVLTFFCVLVQSAAAVDTPRDFRRLIQPTVSHASRVEARRTTGTIARDSGYVRHIVSRRTTTAG